MEQGKSGNGFESTVDGYGTATYDRWAAMTRHEGHFVSDMDKAFKNVQDAEHWKNMVHGVVEASEREVTAAAVVYYTGSVAEFTERDDGRFDVWAEGYYMAMGEERSFF